MIGGAGNNMFRAAGLVGPNACFQECCIKHVTGRCQRKIDYSPMTDDCRDFM